MPHATEIVTLPTSEAFRKDPTIAHPLYALAKEGGAKGIYYGFTEESKEKEEAFMLVVWNSLEDHYKIMNDPVITAKMRPIMAKCVSSPPSMFHVLLEPDTSLASTLNSALISLTQIPSLKPEHGEHVHEVLQKLAVHACPAGHIKTTGCAGTAVEKDLYVALLGWESIQDHHAISSAEGGVGSATKGLVVEDVKTVHIKPTTYLKFQS